jgi:hypothetical protein
MESILQQKFNLIDLSQHFNGLVKRVSFSQLSLFLNLGILSSGTLPPSPLPLSLTFSGSGREVPDWTAITVEHQRQEWGRVRLAGRYSHTSGTKGVQCFSQ